MLSLSVHSNQLEAYALAGKGSILGFDRNCNVRPVAIRPDPLTEIRTEPLDRKYDFYWQNFALFEREDSPQRALGLGVVRVGQHWRTYDHGDVSLELENVGMEGLQNWAGDNISLNFKMDDTRTGESIFATPEDGFQYNVPLPEERIYYRVSNAGNFLWESLNEIGKADALPKVHPQVRGFLENYNHRDSHGIVFFSLSVAFSIRADQIPHPENPHTLSLVVKNLANGETFEMEGPSLTSIRQLWEQTSPIYETENIEPYLADLDPIGDYTYYPSLSPCGLKTSDMKREFNERFESGLGAYGK